MRAKRRYHKKRMKAKARDIVVNVWRGILGDRYDDEVVRNMKKNADNLKVCSCEMCRNPRRSKWRRAKGKTRKELLEENPNER